MKFRELAFEQTKIEIIDGDRGKNYPKKHELKNYGHTLFLNNKNIINNFLDDSFGEYITKEKSDLLRKGKLEREDLVMSTRGSVGNIGYYSSKIETENIRINSGMVIIRNKDVNIDTEYLYVLLTSNLMKKRILEKISGSVQNQLPIRDLKKIKLPIPDLKNQQKIKTFILNFDKKIEVNNKIIENLEAQAQAIFKSWFVDFEPFADGDFVESDLGLIPKGWEVKELEDIFEFKKGRKPKKIKEDFKEGYIPYLIKGVIDGNEKPKFTNENKIVKIEELDSFMLMDGANSGNIYYGYEGALGSTFSFLETKNKKYEDILYWFLKENELIIKNQNTGSAIPHANKDFINNMKIAVPKNISENLVSPILRTYRKKIIHTNKENNKLASIRDTLLPRLMAGEIDLSNINIED